MTLRLFSSKMPRYEPPAAETEPLLAPSTTPTRPQQTRTASDQQPARYQHLNMETHTPITTPTYRQPRSSPLRCQGCFDLCIPSFSDFNLKLPTRAMITGYTAGIIFSIGWWVFIDGCVFNSVHYVEGGRMNYLSFEDWVPGLLSTLALIM